MKRILPFFFFAILFFSCDNPKDKSNPETTSTQPDPFRENVLRIRRVGLLQNISDKTLDSLIVVYEKDTINGLKNLLVKSGDMLQLDLQLNGQTPVDVYKKISEQVGNKYPDLKNDSLKFWYLHSKPTAKDTDWILMRQRIGNETYMQKLYYYNDWPMDETFCKLYNVRLAQEKKDYRIYLVTFMCSNCFNPISDDKVKPDIGTMGILRLTKTQADTLMPIDDLAMDPVDEFNVYTPEKVEQKIKQFESTGLLVKNDSAWWRDAKDDMRKNEVYGLEDIYNYYLDTLFCSVNFDTANEYNPYEDILKKMQSISRGKFNAGVIADEEQYPGIRTVRFTVKGKAYEMDFESQNGILDPKILDEVNTALEEQKIGGAFYTVLSNNNNLLLVYIDNDKLEKAKASGFFTEFIKGAAQQLRDRYAGPTAQQ